MKFRRPRLVGVILVGAALLFVEVTVGFSLAGPDVVSGVGRSQSFYVSDTFSSGGPVTTTGDIQWQVSSGAWRSDGAVATATAPGSTLEAIVPDSSERLALSITWQGSPAGTTVEVAWAQETSWSLTLRDDGYELRDPQGVVQADGPINEALLDSPTLRFEFASSALSLHDDTRELARVATPIPSTDVGFTLVARQRGVSIDRVELKLRPTRPD